MRAFILCDYEGTTGTVTWDEQDSLGPDAMAGDLNAAIAGLRRGGFDRFVARDYHGNGRTIRPADVDPAAMLIRGRSTPFPYGLSGHFDAMAFVGAHAMAGTAQGVMCHTMDGDLSEARLNGVCIGEIGGFALLAGCFDVPLILVTGDDAACAEASEIVPGVETAAVKVGLSRQCAQCLHPSTARELISGKAAEAARRAKEIQPVQWEPPFVLELTFRGPEMADRSQETLAAERVGDRCIRIERDTIADTLRCFERGFQ